MLDSLPSDISLSGLHALIFEPARIPYAIMAILLVSVVGIITGPRAGNANPMLWIWADALFGKLGEKLYKKGRPAPDLMLRGFMVLALAVFVAGLLAQVAGHIILHYDTTTIMHIVILAACLSSGALWFTLLMLYFALTKKGEVKGAYFSLARTTRLDLNTVDDYGITRLGVAQAARIFDKGLVAPVLWYLIGGFTALFVTGVVSAMAWRFGKNGFSKGFGAVPLALDKLLGYVPSLIAALLITAASTFTPTAGIGRSIASWWGQGAPYAQGGHPVAAMAWALNITLGGPAQDLSGSTVPAAWIGPKGATARLEPGHLRRGLYIILMAHLLWLAVLLGAFLWSFALGS